MISSHASFSICKNLSDFCSKKDETNIQFTKMINMMGLTPPFKRKTDYSSIENAYFAYQLEESNLTQLCEFD